MTRLSRMASVLAHSDADLGDEEACLRMLHVANFRRLHEIPDSEWLRMLDEARRIRAASEASSPSIAEIAAAFAFVALVVGLKTQGMFV